MSDGYTFERRRTMTTAQQDWFTVLSEHPDQTILTRQNRCS